MKNHLFLILLLAIFFASQAQTITTVAGGNGEGSAADQFNLVSDVAFDSVGNMYAVDGSNYRIQRFPPGSTSSTNGITVAGGNGYGSAANQLANPRSIFIDRAGYIYIADQTNNRIQKFPPGSSSATAGTTVAGRLSAGDSANQLHSATALFVDNTGNIYVADGQNNRIQKFPAGSDSTTNAITVAGGNGSGSANNQFNEPDGIFVDKGGNIYVADLNNNRVLKFPPGSDSSTYGITVAGGNGPGGAADQLDEPDQIFVDAYGYIYVSDNSNGRIQKFPPNSTSITNGVTVAGGNGDGSAPDQLYFPIGVFVDDSGNIYIADNFNERVQKWSQSIVVPTISTGQVLINTTFCAGSDGSVLYSVTGTFNSDNIFTAQLSNASGSFSSPVNIGTLASDTNGSIPFTIPVNATAGNGYRIRVVSSDPAITGTDNGIDLTITVLPAPKLSLSGNLCSGNDTLTVTGAAGATLINWYMNDSLVDTGTTDLYIPTSVGNYTVTYANSSGCFSGMSDNIVVHSGSFNDTVNQMICSGQSYDGHSTNGMYTDTFTLAGGCDSIRILNLTVDSLLSTINKQRICVGDTFQGHTTTGNYTDTFTSAGGCDSFVTIELQVDTLPVSISIRQQGDTLSTAPGYTYYGWYLDSTLVSSGSDNTYIITHSGNYYVQISSGDGNCSVSSTAVIAYLTGIEKVNDGPPSLSIYPNPASNLVKISLSGLQSNQALSIKVYNTVGQKVSEVAHTPAGKNYSTQLDVTTWAKGVYLLQIQEGDWEMTQRVVVE